MWYHRTLVVVACSALFALVIGSAMDASAADSTTHTGKVVSASEGTLVMSDADGTNEHSHAIIDACTITLDGQAVKLAELKKGVAVTITTEQREGKDVVIKVAATS